MNKLLFLLLALVPLLLVLPITVLAQTTNMTAEGQKLMSNESNPVVVKLADDILREFYHHIPLTAQDLKVQKEACNYENRINSNLSNIDYLTTGLMGELGCIKTIKTTHGDLKLEPSGQ
jgi:hypothetical protein